MVEKKATTKATATKAAAAKKPAAAKKAPVAKKTTTATAKKVELVLSWDNAGYKAGDVYQALAAAEAAQSVAEIAKAASISEEEVILGIGWLFKEGKIKNEENKVALA
jgi:hypothetical protein